MQLKMYRGDRPAALRLLATLLREFMHLRAALAQAGFELLSSSANEHGQVLRFGRRFGRRMAMRSTWRPTWQVLEMALSAPLWAPHGDALDMASDMAGARHGAFGAALGAAWRCARQTKPLHLATARSLLDAPPRRRPDPARGAPSRGGSGLPAGGARPAPTTAPRAHGMHARRGAPLACTTRSSTATLGC